MMMMQQPLQPVEEETGGKSLFVYIYIVELAKTSTQKCRLFYIKNREHDLPIRRPPLKPALRPAAALGCLGGLLVLMPLLLLLLLQEWRKRIRIWFSLFISCFLGFLLVYLQVPPELPALVCRCAPLPLPRPSCCVRRWFPLFLSIHAF